MPNRTSGKSNGVVKKSNRQTQMAIDEPNTAAVPGHPAVAQTSSPSATSNGTSNGDARLARSSSLQNLNKMFRRLPGKSSSLSKVFGRKSKRRLPAPVSNPLPQDNVAYSFETQLGPPSPPSVSAMALGMDRDRALRPAFWEIPREKLVIGNTKQRGRFGEIHFGKVAIGNRYIPVDVQIQAASTDKKNILGELSIYSQAARHANVLHLIGACTKSGPAYLVFESVEPVRLDVFLRTIQDVHKPISVHIPGFNITLPLMPQILKFAVDIASGLSHLASKRVVQHSLGVRNVVVTVDLVAKVTDFAAREEGSGLGRQPQNGSEEVPSLFSRARWMAYETLAYGSYTEKSNVWSLGVMIWEVMSYGREPFEGFQSSELSRRLSEGYTLHQPDGCPDDIYEIIQSCLRLESSERPMIKILVARLATRYQRIKMQDEETRSDVSQALAQLSENHDNMSPPQVRSMEMLVNSNANQKLPQARLMAVQYAATAFPGNHVASKYTILSACGDENEVVRNEATSFIRAQGQMAERDIMSEAPLGKMLPSFPQMINFIRQKAFDNLPKSSQKSQGPLGVFTIPFKALVYEKVAVYLRMCLAYSAGASPNVFKTNEMIRQGPVMSPYINGLIDIHAGEASAPILAYMGLLRQYVSAIGGGRGLYSLLELVAMAPDKLAQQFVKKVESLKMLLHSAEEVVRLYASQLMGVVLCYAPPSMVVGSITQFTSRMDTGSVDSSQAMLWALGYIIGRQMQKEALAGRDTFTRLSSSQDLGEENVYRRATEAIVAKLESNHPTIVKAACTAIAEIARNGPLALLKGGKTNDKTGSGKGSVGSARSRNGSSGRTKLGLVQRLAEILKADVTLYMLDVRMEACSALAHLAVGEAEFPYRKLVLEALHKAVWMSAPSTQELFSFNFHLADCLADALQGPESPATLDPWLERNQTPLGHSTPVSGDLNTILESLLKDGMQRHDSGQREASCMLLLVLLETFRHSHQLETHITEMMTIAKEIVDQWNEQDVITKLPQELQRRILIASQLSQSSRVASSFSSATSDAGDISSHNAPDISHDAPNISSHDAPDISSHDAPDISSHDAPDISHDALDISSHDAPDISSHDAPDISSHDASDISSHDAPDISSHDAPDIPYHDAPDIPYHDAPDIPYHDAPDIPYHDAPDISYHDAPDIYSHDAPDMSPHDALDTLSSATELPFHSPGISSEVPDHDHDHDDSTDVLAALDIVNEDNELTTL